VGARAHSRLGWGRHPPAGVERWFVPALGLPGLASRKRSPLRPVALVGYLHRVRQLAYGLLAAAAAAAISNEQPAASQQQRGSQQQAQ